MQLTGEGFLLTLSQIGLGFAGFSGLIAVFRHRADQVWQPREIAGIKLILEHTLGLVMYSLLPFLFFLLLQNEDWVWRCSSALLCVFLISEIIIQNVRVSTITAIGQAPGYPGLLVYVFFVPTLFLAVIQLVNMFFGHLFLYALGLFWLLTAAGFQFWLLLLRYTAVPPAK